MHKVISVLKYIAWIILFTPAIAVILLMLFGPALCAWYAPAHVAIIARILAVMFYSTLFILVAD